MSRLKKEMIVIKEWFKTKGFKPFAYQVDAWQSYLEGKHFLIHVPTGFGKTYGAFLGPLAKLAKNYQKGLKVLYISPLRAVTNDIEKAVVEITSDLNPELTVATRSGDTSSYRRQKIAKNPPSVLLTTPESFALLLTNKNAEEYFSGLDCVIVDEWHELLGNKRGSLLQLNLASVLSFRPELQVIGLSATLQNPQLAADYLFPRKGERKVISAPFKKNIEIEILLPDKLSSFPWYGHLGKTMLDPLVDLIKDGKTSLIFTNTRSQAELWHQMLIERRSELAGEIAIHHGSLDREQRQKVEFDIKNGELSCVICTSSLDLGVDFSTVDRVIQIGSPKGIARFVQRAGRSGHSPGLSSQIIGVPTHALEIIEFKAAEMAIAERRVEPVIPLEKPLDVMCQHIVSRAMRQPLSIDQLYDEITTAYCFRELSREELCWGVDFLTRGGESLNAYEHYKKVKEIDGRLTVESKRIMHLHKLNIGTIVADGAVQVCFRSGKSLGSVEERFIARIKPGDKFIFAGRLLELSKVYDMKAFVKPAKGRPDTVPAWVGGRMPLSTELSLYVLKCFERILTGEEDELWLEKLAPITKKQKSLSTLPTKDRLLFETFDSREGSHLFFYPFAGRLVHEGIAALIAFRLSKKVSTTFSVSANDYGIEILSTKKITYQELWDDQVTASKDLAEDILSCINLGEMGKIQFREIARICGLVTPNFPGSKKSTRQVQASANLIYDVFRRFEPQNLLLKQAEREVLEAQLEFQRLKDSFESLSTKTPVWHSLRRPSPLGFPLLIDRMSGKFSSEKLIDRIERMIAQWQDR